MIAGYNYRMEVEAEATKGMIEVLRFVGYTVYMGIPSKKGKMGLKKYYPLPWDKKDAKMKPALYYEKLIEKIERLEKKHGL